MRRAELELSGNDRGQVCHCGEVEIVVPRQSRAGGDGLRIARCVRRYGTLWAYYPRSKSLPDSGAARLDRVLLMGPARSCVRSL